MKTFLRPHQVDFEEDISVDIIEFKNIKKGDKFYECDHKFGNIELIALTDAQKTMDGWICKVKSRDNDQATDIFVSANTNHFGPNFFKTPQIIEQNEEGEFGFFLAP